MEHGLVVLHFLFPTNEQAAKAIHPGVGPFDHPSSGPVSGNRRFFFFLFAARTQMKDISQLGHLFPDDRIVVSLIQAQMLRVLRVRFRSRSSRLGQRGPQQFHIVTIRPIDDDAQGHAASIRPQTPLGSTLAAIRRVRTRLFFPQAEPWSWLRPPLARSIRFLWPRRTLATRPPTSV